MHSLKFHLADSRSCAICLRDTPDTEEVRVGIFLRGWVPECLSFFSRSNSPLPLTVMRLLSDLLLATLSLGEIIIIGAGASNPCSAGAIVYTENDVRAPQIYE